MLVCILGRLRTYDLREEGVSILSRDNLGAWFPATLPHRPIATQLLYIMTESNAILFECMCELSYP